jgi:hypothetical protein
LAIFTTPGTRMKSTLVEKLNEPTSGEPETISTERSSR